MAMLCEHVKRDHNVPELEVNNLNFNTFGEVQSSKFTYILSDVSICSLETQCACISNKIMLYVSSSAKKKLVVYLRL